MMTYRVGEAGATVFTKDGRPLATLTPGQVVIEGRLKDAGSLAAQYHALPKDAPKKRRYADKAVHPPEDKAR